jgi:hypothetical protein
MAFASLALTTEGKSDPRQAALHRVALDCTRTLADYMLAQQEVPTSEYVSSSCHSSYCDMQND